MFIWFHNFNFITTNISAKLIVNLPEHVLHFVQTVMYDIHALAQNKLDGCTHRVNGSIVDYILAANKA